jgi:hypothetical protein
MTALHVCWIPISPRWVYVCFLAFQLIGIITMYFQKSIYFNTEDDDNKRKPVVHDEAMTNSVTGNKKRRNAYRAIKDGGKRCCGFLDGFNFIHFVAVPTMWLIFVFMNMRGTESDIFEATLFLLFVNFAKTFALLDDHATYAAVGFSVFSTFAVIEIVSLIWRGVQVFRTFSYDPLRRSGWMVSWWLLILVYVLGFDIYVSYVLLQDDIKIDKLAAALLRKTRINIAIWDSLYIWLSGCILFSFIY